MNEKIRCSWCTNDDLYKSYHDKEWGVPITDEYKLFEFLTLEIFQAGLSWYTVLKKRESFISAFDKFDFEKISTYDSKKIEKLMIDKCIIRNKLKINSTIINAKKFMEVQKTQGSFNKYLSNYKKKYSITKKYASGSYELALELSKDLKQKGFKFIGPTIINSFLMAVGVINGHQKNCFRYLQLSS